VPASFISAESLHCLTPSSGSGSVAVEVSNAHMHTAADGRALSGVNPSDLELYSSNGITFDFQDEVTLSNAWPSSGSVAGGTVIAIHGAGFVDSAELSCRFAGIVVKATFVSAMVVRCTAPAQKYAMLTGVSVANNGADFSAEIQFSYFIAPTVKSVSPPRGQAAGGTLVSVSGENFVPSNDLKCRFGSTVVPANYLSPTAVGCLSPPGKATSEVQRIVASASAKVNEVQKITTTALPNADEVQRVTLSGWGLQHGVQTVRTRTDTAGGNGQKQEIKTTVEHTHETHVITTHTASKTHEVQRIAIASPTLRSTDGKFSVTYGFSTTPELPVDSSAATLAMHLSALPELGSVQVQQPNAPCTGAAAACTPSLTTQQACEAAAATCKWEPK